MNMTEVRQVKVLPGGALHIPAPIQVMGPPSYTRVVVFEWPLPHYAQLSYRGIAHLFCNGEGNPPNSCFYFKKWCQFHGRYHFFLELHEVFPTNIAGGGQFLPLVPIGQPPLGGGGEANGGGGGEANGGGGGGGGGEANGGGGGGEANGGGIHHCIGIIDNIDDYIFWDDGAHQGGD